MKQRTWHGKGNRFLQSGTAGLPQRSTPDEKQRSSGFTLIELLVVISVIAMLMAVLMPTLRRVRDQAKAIACQSNLRQWGVILSIYTTENDHRLTHIRFSPFFFNGFADAETSQGQVGKDIRFCPMAPEKALSGQEGFAFGGTFIPWRDTAFSDYDRRLVKTSASYGANGWIGSDDPTAWRTDTERQTEPVPVMLDGSWAHVSPEPTDAPPEKDAVPFVGPSIGQFDAFCINRHHGSVNSLFLDWSVRKVGLKELWTLKWHKQYDTTGPWTQAGGVEPEEWPPWMRGFKDY